jgi:hypothetical protein
MRLTDDAPRGLGNGFESCPPDRPAAILAPPVGPGVEARKAGIDLGQPDGRLGVLAARAVEIDAHHVDPAEPFLATARLPTAGQSVDLSNEVLDDVRRFDCQGSLAVEEPGCAATRNPRWRLSSPTASDILLYVTKRLIDVDDQKLDAVRTLLGTQSLKATVNAALDEVLALDVRRRALLAERGVDLAELADPRARDTAWG